MEVLSVQISARNQLKATITEINKGPVSTEVVLDVRATLWQLQLLPHQLIT